MPDNENLLNTQELEDSVSIDNLTQSPDLDGDDVIVMVHENNGVKSTYKAILRSIANFINKLLHYSTDLHTQNDTIIGAINELADGGGGSADIISEASGAIATFNDGGDNIPVKSLVTDIVATQSGTGTPSPSNVRSISGFDEVGVFVASKNLFDITVLNKGNVTVSNGVASGTTEAFHNAFSNGSIIPLPKTQIVFSFYAYTDQSASSTGNGLRGRIVYADGTSDDVFCPNSTTSYTRFTIVSNAEKTPTRLTFTYSSGKNNTWYVKDVQLELGNEVTTYEAYNGTTHTISLPETIYGGYLDVVNGDLVITHVFYDLANYTGTITRATQQSTPERTYFRFDDLSPYPLSSGDLLCDKFEQVSITLSTDNIGVAIGNPSALGHTTVYFRPENPDSYTTSTIMDYIQTTLGGLQIVYKLATPIRLSVTGANIPTLSGVNNIYSNIGDVEVEYFNENADQTSELIDAKQEYANYSSEEKVVGKWLDGSPLYEKTLFFNNKKLDKADDTSELVHGIANIGSTRFVAEVYFDFAGGQYGWSPANNGLWNNGVYNFYWVCGETSLYILSASGVYFDANPNRSYLVKIRYTKA